MRRVAVIRPRCGQGASPRRRSEPRGAPRAGCARRREARKGPGQEQPRDQCGWSQGSEGKKEGSESGGWDRGAFVALRRPLERPLALTLKKLGSNGRI